jgi:MraZ protein
MFRGNFTAKIDEKGRVSFPARFREALDTSGSDEVCITNFRVDGRNCLDVYPQAKWLDMEQRLRESQERSPRVIKFFQNYYLPGVQECRLDRQGRILLCPRLREYANLDREVVLIGIGNKLRIFDPDSWNSVFSSGEASLPEDPDVVAALGV